MTIASTTARNTYTLNGATTVYPYTYRILNAADLRVVRRSAVTGAETVLVRDVDYSVTGVGNTLGGAITLTSAGTSGDTLVIRRNRALKQETQLTNQGPGFPASAEAALDGLLTIDQQQQDDLDRALKLPVSLDPSGRALTLEPTAGKVVTGTGTGFTMSSLDASATALPGEGRTVTTLSGYLSNNRVYHTDDYSAIGADLGTRINYILGQVNKRAATIVVPSGSVSFAVAIDATDARSVRFTTKRSGNPNSVTDWGPNLIWTGGAGSGPAVKLIGATACEWDHINLSYNNAAYDGSLLSLSSVGGVQNTSTIHVHHARLSGTPTAKLAACLIELNTTLGFSMDNVTLDYAVCGVKSTGNSNNVITIGENCWFDKHFTDCQIKAWGGAWRLSNFVAESDPTAGVPLTPLLKLAGETNGLMLDSLMCVDGGNGGGTLVDLTGAVSRGVAVVGGNYGAASGTFLRASDTAAATQGLSVRGVSVTGLSVGVHLGRSDGAVVDGNYLNCTTPWTGTAPTRYRVGPNSHPATSTSGVPVANGASIAITPPGSANDGFGIVWIACTEDGSQARYELRGSLAGTREAEDVDGHYTPTVGTVASTNIYWDAGTVSYRLQNNRGGARTYTVTYVGR